jgi:anti-anti-sigma factor
MTEETMSSEIPGQRSGSGPSDAPPALEINLLTGCHGVSIAGMLDVTTSELMASRLQPLITAGDDVRVDLSGLTFADVSGATVLATSAQQLPAGRRLVLERPPRQLRRIIDLFWSDLRCIEVVTR